MSGTEMGGVVLGVQARGDEAGGAPQLPGQPSPITTARNMSHHPSPAARNMSHHPSPTHVYTFPISLRPSDAISGTGTARYDMPGTGGAYCTVSGTGICLAVCSARY
eukprot:2952530-Rhodomonas_salina.1